MPPPHAPGRTALSARSGLTMRSTYVYKHLPSGVLCFSGYVFTVRLAFLPISCLCLVISRKQHSDGIDAEDAAARVTCPFRKSSAETSRFLKQLPRIAHSWLSDNIKLREGAGLTTPPVTKETRDTLSRVSLAPVLGASQRVRPCSEFSRALLACDPTRDAAFTSYRHDAYG